LSLKLKTVEAFTEVHTAQTLNYLKIGNNKLGLLINFQELHEKGYLLE